jgi:hypothetical protein
MASNAGIQPKGATNNGNLLIPNKTMATFSQPEYGTDMRAIERWCNSLIDAGGQPIFEASYVQGPSDFTVYHAPTVGAPVDTTKFSYGPMTAPPSGSIRAEITIPWNYSGPAAGVVIRSYVLGLCMPATPTVSYPAGAAPFIDSVNSAYPAPSVPYSYASTSSIRLLLTGLTPGTEYTFQLWHQAVQDAGQGYVIWPWAIHGPVMALFYDWAE